MDKNGAPDWNGMDTNFNLEDDYKPQPLIPKGQYYGHVIAFSVSGGALVWKVALANNGVYKSDGDTPVDGSHVNYRNWLPKDGDRNEPAASGDGSKFDTKVRMLKEFADGMQVNLDSPAIINQHITDGDLIGLPVIVGIDVGSWKGRARNEINTMILNPDEDYEDD